MKLNLYILLYTVLLFSCNRGIWIHNNAFRPKHENYQLKKQAFVWNPSIDTQFVYVTKNPFLNYTNDSIYSCMYFFADGKMAIDHFDSQKEVYSYAKAFAVGYYTLQGNKLITELFMPGQGGFYLQRTATVGQDLLIFKDTSVFSAHADTLKINRKYRSE